MVRIRISEWSHVVFRERSVAIFRRQMATARLKTWGLHTKVYLTPLTHSLKSGSSQHNVWTPSSRLFIERELGIEQLGDFAAEQVPLEAVLSLRVFVLVVHADSLEQRLARPCFSHKHTTCVICSLVLTHASSRMSFGRARTHT
jgi:hypothetical protein